MNRYYMIRRLMGPAILLLLGTIALLHEAHLASWHLFVPLLLILIGVIKLAERAVLASEPPPPGTGYPGGPYQPPYAGSYQPPYPGQPYQGTPYQGPYPSAGYPGTMGSTAAPPAQDAGNKPEGGKQ